MKLISHVPVPNAANWAIQMLISINYNISKIDIVTIMTKIQIQKQPHAHTQPHTFTLAPLHLHKNSSLACNLSFLICPYRVLSDSFSVAVFLQLFRFEVQSENFGWLTYPNWVKTDVNSTSSQSWSKFTFLWVHWKFILTGLKILKELSVDSQLMFLKINLQSLCVVHTFTHTQK